MAYSKEFVITKEMVESDECPLDCPNLGGHRSNPWTCKTCGGLRDTYDMGMDHNYPLKGEECTLHRIFYARQFEILERLLLLVDGLDAQTVVIGGLRRDEIADALRFAIAEARKG